MKKVKATHYYRIRKNVFWGMIGGFAILLAAAFFSNKISDEWLHIDWEEVSFEGIESRLEYEEDCFLCGSSEQSLAGYYQTMDALGLVSLNDWYVLNLYRRDSDEETGFSVAVGNTGEMSYMSQTVLAGKVACLDITLPEHYGLKTETIQNNLCQDCLDKVVGALSYSRSEEDKGSVIPLCLVDFQTLEVYSMQNLCQGGMIREYWVETKQEENTMEVRSFYLNCE